MSCMPSFDHVLQLLFVQLLVVAVIEVEPRSVASQRLLLHRGTIACTTTQFYAPTTGKFQPVLQRNGLQFWGQVGLEEQKLSGRNIRIIIISR
jgi:hypothetical protein